MTKQDKLKLCVGCRDNFYNGNNDIGVKECWSLKSANRVRRWRCGWWTPQDKKSAFYPITTLSCHRAPGQYADYDELPRHLGGGKPPK